MIFMTDVVTTTKSVMGNFSGIFFKWGVPFISLGVGYATGDFIGIADKIKKFDKIMIGTALFKIATIGKVIAMGLFGIALRMIFTAI